MGLEEYMMPIVIVISMLSALKALIQWYVTSEHNMFLKIILVSIGITDAFVGAKWCNADISISIVFAVYYGVALLADIYTSQHTIELSSIFIALSRFLKPQDIESCSVISTCYVVVVLCIAIISYIHYLQK